MSGSNRRNWSSVRPGPEPKSPTSARSAGVHMAVSKQETTCNPARQAGSARQTSPLTPLQTGTESAAVAGDFAQFVAACYRLNCSGRIRGDWQTSRRTGLTSFVKACAVQRRVIGALLMRELQLRWGRRNLGFAWLFCEPLIFALPVLAMWSLLHSGLDR